MHVTKGRTRGKDAGLDTGQDTATLRVAFRSANLLKVSLVTTAAMLAICLLAFAETTDAAETASLPDNGKIAFESFPSGRAGSIYTVEN